MEAGIREQDDSGVPRYQPALCQVQPSQATEAWAEGGNFGGLPEAGLNGLPGQEACQQQRPVELCALPSASALPWPSNDMLAP